MSALGPPGVEGSCEEVDCGVIGLFGPGCPSGGWWFLSRFKMGILSGLLRIHKKCNNEWISFIYFVFNFINKHWHTSGGEQQFDEVCIRPVSAQSLQWGSELWGCHICLAVNSTSHLSPVSITIKVILFGS